MIMSLSAVVHFAVAQLKAGSSAPDFSLPGIDGKTITLSKLNDVKGVILIFSCNTCPFAVKYEDRINELHGKYASKGFPVVMINPNDLSQKPDDSMEAMKKRAKDKKFGFAYLRDDSQAVAKAYGAQRTPEVFLLVKAAEGFKVAYTGTIDNNVDNPSAANKFYVQDAVNAVLSGKEPLVAETKAVGCTIKWK